MNNDFWYIFSMVVIVASAVGLGTAIGFIIGLKHGVAMILEDVDDSLLDAEELI